MLITSAIISGLALGSMYGLLALGFYMTYAVSSTVNFAQGSSMMLGAVLAYSFAVTLGWPFIPAALVALGWAQGSVQLAGINVSLLQIAIPLVGLALAALLSFFFRNTKQGKAML